MGSERTTPRSIDEMSVEELALAARAGRRECFDALAERLRPRLRSFLLGRTSRPEDADDLVQESLLRAYAELDRYDARWRFSTWLFTIAKRLAASHHRASRPTSELGDRAAPAPAAEEISDRREGERLWHTARAVLGDREYRALYLRYAEDLPVKEVASRLGVSLVHARVILYRARRRLATEVS